MAESTDTEGLLRRAAILITSISDSQQADIVEYIDANELGLALDTLCAFLYEDDLHLSHEAYHLLAKAGNALGIEMRVWEKLKDLDQE